MDAITLLKNEHAEVEKLFKSYEAFGERAYKSKEKVAQRIIAALSVHAEIEEQVFYPAIRAEVEGTKDDVLESIEEHHIVKWVLQEIKDLDPRDERYDAKMTVLIENVRHHVKEEEKEMFPAVRKALGRSRLNEIGEALEASRKLAPTSPHPRSPSTPPGNIVAAPLAKVMDTAKGKAKDLIPG
jgi:hemerythrin-like domain-containing protein